MSLLSEPNRANIVNTSFDVNESSIGRLYDTRILK
jgi:hypothetical protein